MGGKNVHRGPLVSERATCIYVGMGYGDLRGKAFLVQGICISVSLCVFLHSFQEKKSEEELKMRLMS